MRNPDDRLISRLRFRHLELIKSLCATGSLHKTAKAMNQSQPAISKALMEVESSFGFQLFERSPAGVAVTPRGRTILEGATLLLNSLLHLRKSAVQNERRIQIRLGVAPFVSVILMPRVLWALRRQGDEVSISLREGINTENFESFRNGGLDALVGPLPLDLTGLLPATGLTIRKLLEDGLTVVAAIDHPLSRRRRVSWQEIVGERWILHQHPTSIGTSIRSAFTSQGLVPPTPWIESNHPLTNIELVAAGHGIAAVPALLAQRARARGLVSALRVEPKAHRPPFSIIFRSIETDSPPIRALTRALDVAVPQKIPLRAYRGTE